MKKRGLLIATLPIAAIILIIVLVIQGKSKPHSSDTISTSKDTSINQDEDASSPDVEDYNSIASLSDCKEELFVDGEPYTAENSKYTIYSVTYPNETIDDFLGFCIFAKDENTLKAVAGGPNHRPPNILTVTQAQKLIWSQGCGTECNLLYTADIDNPKESPEFIAEGRGYEVINDQYLIGYKTRLYLQDGQDYSADDYAMVYAIDLSSLEIKPLIENPLYTDNPAVSIANINQVEVALISQPLPYFDETSQALKVPFVIFDSSGESPEERYIPYKTIEVPLGDIEAEFG